ncbi:TonB-dependent receptor domain-containing protein [Haliea sp. E17]|uniref:TonB-dependent receptor domain-containing protein n=1 Tax=Haliea sp. E17 TaxID=3401576 RepID=UPI003AABE5AC
MTHTLREAVRRYTQYLAAGTTSLALIPGSVLGQDQDSSKTLMLEEVVVTGTLIRGIQPTGSQVIGIDEDAVTEIGAVTTNEMLATVPQVSNFFNARPEQDPRGTDRLTLNRPNLRALPGINSASGSTTLVLVDSHRLTPMGVNESSLDADVIPANVIQRIDIVPDGGSSLYGADAVGGVINFVTLDKYDGVKVDLGYDIGDDYDAGQAALIAGTSWEGGNGYISVSTTDRGEVLNRDRDWATYGNWNEDGTVLTPSGTECLEPAGSVKRWFWVGNVGGNDLNIWTDNPAAPGTGVFPVGDPCDINGAESLLPKQERDNLYGSVSQDIGDNMTLSAKAYYMDRKTTYAGYPLGDSVNSPTPTELGVVGTQTGDLYDQPAVGFSYAPNAAYKQREREVEIETWGITPELIIKLGQSSWQLRNTLHYGLSKNKVVNPDSNRQKMLAYVDEGLFDPLNVAAADAAVVTDILNWQFGNETEQEMFLFRTIADGELIELPAGTMRAAVGVEYMRDDAKKHTGSTEIGGLDDLGWNSANRDLTSAYAELSIPVLESLDLSVSARYDDYSDFGSTTNPSLGASWRPASWIEIYGKWGQSFNAPTLLDSLATATGGFYANQANVVPDPNNELTDPARVDSFLLEGAGGELKPQSAEIWAAGIVVYPVDNLRLNLNYYDIDFVDLLGAVDPTSATAVLQNPDKIIFSPTQEELDYFISQVENADQFTDLDASTMGVIVDRRQTNTDSARLKGFDFGAQYYHETGFGDMSYGISGTFTESFDITKNGFSSDQLKYNPDLLVTGSIGWTRDNIRTKLTLNYTDKSDADPAEAVNQSSKDSFLLTNFFASYNFSAESGFTSGLSLRLVVDNVFDEDPPEYRRQQNFNYVGFTLGRVYKLGLTKTF